MYFILVRKSSSFYLTRHSSKKISGLFALLEVDSAAGHSNDTKTIVRNLAVEITKGGRQSLEWDEMHARYVISLSKVKLEEQLCFAVKLNIMHIHRIQAALKAIVKYIEDNKLNR